MRILMVGAGATGGYYGARLALAGRDVTFLVRGKRAEQLAHDGLRISGPSGDATLTSPKTISADALKSAGAFDLVIVSTKAYSLDSAMDDIAPGVGADTVILPILNGMRHLDILRERFGKDRVMGGTVRIVCDLAADGTIHQMTDLDQLSFGELPSTSVILSQARSAQSKDLLSPEPSGMRKEIGRARSEEKERTEAQSPRAASIYDTLNVPGITLTLSPDILATMWQKWWILSTMGAVCVLGGGTVGDVIATGLHGIQMAKDIQREAISIAAANGYPADPAFAANHEKRMTEPGSQLTSSMYRDMTKGLPVEADHILGDLLARANGTPAPLLAAAYTHLKVYEGRRR